MCMYIHISCIRRRRRSCDAIATFLPPGRGTSTQLLSERKGRSRLFVRPPREIKLNQHKRARERERRHNYLLHFLRLEHIIFLSSILVVSSIDHSTISSLDCYNGNIRTLSSIITEMELHLEILRLIRFSILTREC